MSVSVNGPKTPLTKGSNGIATATLPNICKMPGPPAPFVPAPLPNIGKSGDNPKDYSKKVKIEKKTVAIKGASFGSIGDMASKGTGGGMLSANTHGPCKFISPGSMDVKFEGKNVHFLSDLVTNNGGPSGSPPNAATMMGAIQLTGVVYVPKDPKCPICGEEHEDFKESPQTKIDAMALVNAYNPSEDYMERKGTMIGVVHCKKGHKHAGRTNNDPNFVAAASAYHLATQASDPFRTVVRMTALTDGIPAFRIALQLARIEAWVERLREPRERVSRNTPGACAAQKALVSTLSHGCTPSAITEKWKANPPMFGGVAPVRHINLAGKLDARRFIHGESVPPCETCNLLLPFLTCQRENDPNCPTSVPGCPRNC
jgi:hypothetical protein